MNVCQMKISNLGYPRIDEQQEWKKALEAFWSGNMGEADFLQKMKTIRLHHLQKQKAKHLDYIPVGDFSLYDHMLDTAVMFGLVPQRFAYEGGPVSLQTYFAMARGSHNAEACERTRWFDTNYDYIVPEFGHTTPALTENKPLAAYLEARQELDIHGKPVIIGPYTFCKLSRGYPPERLPQVIDLILPLYARVLRELAEAGVQWVQIDEPVLATSLAEEEIDVIESVYRKLHEAAPSLNIMLQTYFGAVDLFPRIIGLPVQGIGLDFVHSFERHLQAIGVYGFPADKVLGLGLVDGRSIWRTHLPNKWKLLTTIMSILPENTFWLQPSSSLLHVPVILDEKNRLEPAAKKCLASADEKLDELGIFLQAFRHGEFAVMDSFVQSQSALSQLPKETVASLKSLVAAGGTIDGQ
ncbi:hypothetical protein [Brevibacillus borstelensis]|uniref:hypothetical protein n=1 Tax=Brevibacillus borstelensis TaxID=45462 RepID=UPI0030C1C7E6